MTTQAWPSTLEDKLMSVSGYGETAASDPAVRTTMDSGPPKSRARFTAIPKKIEGIIDTLTSDEVDYLIDFWETTCKMGTLPFAWVHPRKGTTVTYIWLKYPDVSTSNNSPILFTATMSLIIMPT